METLRASPFAIGSWGSVDRYREGAVDEEVVRARAEVVHRHGHGLERRLQDVDAVDLEGIDDADPDRETAWR